MNQPETRVTEPYDFRRPTTLAREHSRVLENAFETFSRQWGTQLTANIRTRSQVTFDGVAMHTYDEYATSLPSATTMVLIDMGDEASKAILQYPATAALNWFSYMIGGSGTDDTTERTFTQLEQTLHGKLLEDLLEDVKYSLGQLVTVDMKVESTSHNSQFAQAAAPATLMVVAEFTVQTGDRTAAATLAIPAEILLNKLGDANPVVRDIDSKTLLAEGLSTVPVDVSLQLPAITVNAEDILRLTVGQELLLGHPTHRPLDVAVEGKILASAALGKNGKRLALLITDTKENQK